jgi:excisionase family DNA binding protein
MASEQNTARESFMTVAEVATILKLNQQTVRNWIDGGKLPAIHVGRRVRIKRSDFERLIEQGYSTALEFPRFGGHSLRGTRSGSHLDHHVGAVS